jgi:hypothetical protein
MSSISVKELSHPAGQVIKIAAGKTLDLKSQGTTTLPTGSVLQVTNAQNGSNLSTNSTSYIELTSNFRPTITPTSTSSSVQYSFALNVNADTDTDEHGYVSATIKIDMYIGGSLSSTIYEAGNILDRAGQTRMRHTVLFGTVSPNTTSAVEFRSYIKIEAGSRNVQAGMGSIHSASLMEVSA